MTAHNTGGPVKPGQTFMIGDGSREHFVPMDSWRVENGLIRIAPTRHWVWRDVVQMVACMVGVVLALWCGSVPGALILSAAAGMYLQAVLDLAEKRRRLIERCAKLRSKR